MKNPKELFENNLKLVYKVYADKIAGKPNSEEMKEDLIQIGLMSLWKCCLMYNPSRGTSFSTYAYTAIYKNMTCALVREGKKIAYLVSMNRQVSSEAEDCPITYEDVIASKVNIASEVEIEDLVNQISKELGDNADKVIEMIRQGYKQVDIANEMNITRAKVSIILKKFRKMIKNTLFFKD